MRALAAGVAALATAGIAGPAAAAPERETVPIDCGADGTYLVTVNGNGEFTPGNDTGSTTMVVPIAFENEHFTATAPDGTVLFEETNPDRTTKGRVSDQSPRQQVSCSFTISFVLDQAEDDLPAGTTLTISGDVIGYLTPAR